MNRILICDDEADIRNALKIYLSAEGYEVVEADNGKGAVALLKGDEKIALVLLDIMMPEEDGITALSKIREFSNVPVILLTAKSEDTDIVLGLNVGADDYVTKPFVPVELLARVRSALRRYLALGGNKGKTDREALLSAGGIEVNDREKTVTLDGEPVSLTPTEYDILVLLMKDTGTVFSPKEIYEKVWKEQPMGAEGAVAVHVRHLREKLEYDPAAPRHIVSVWGRGYQFKD